MRLFERINNQVKLLFESNYNRKHPIYAIYRLLFWNICKALKLDFHSTLWGYKFKFWIKSHQSYWLYKNYKLDIAEFDFIQSVSKRDDVIFDVGANIGIYSFWFSKCINDQGKIFSFEPDEQNIEKFKYGIYLNNIKSILPHSVALGNINGEAKFTVGLDELNSIAGDSNIMYDEYRIVEMITLDTFCIKNNIDEINYLKIDVEGAEWFVLNGAGNLLTNNSIKIIQLEINKQLEKFNITVNQIVESMKKFGYELYRLKETLVEVDINNSNLIDEESNNYFFIPDMNYVTNRIKTS